MTSSPRSLIALLLLAAAPLVVVAQPSNPVVPDWSLPGSATHRQVPPPAGFHRPTVNIPGPIGIFEGQSDVGGPLLPGSALYDAATKTYTIHSASSNIWYFRDEFRYLWKRMDGDISLAADVTFPNPDGYFDAKAVFVIRQELDDDAKEIMAAIHSGGLVHMAVREHKAADMHETEHVEGTDAELRIGIQKAGDAFTLWVSYDGEAMHQLGEPFELEFDGPFYVGIGFCSHLPVTYDTAVLSNVVLENAAGKL